MQKVFVTVNAEGPTRVVIISDSDKVIVRVSNFF